MPLRVGSVSESKMSRADKPWDDVNDTEQGNIFARSVTSPRVIFRVCEHINWFTTLTGF